MSSGRLLVMVLNLTGPIPNAASIHAHNPDSVLLVRLEARGLSDEKRLDQSLERLRYWIKGALPELYKFDHDLDLTFSPPSLKSCPDIHVMLAEDVFSASKEIAEKILEICRSSGHHEVRIDVSAGRKEDAAGLARIPYVDGSEGDCSVWYTDTTSGISAEIRGDLVESGQGALDHVSRLWLNGSPVLGVKRVIEVDSVKGDVLTKVLDAIEKTDKIPREFDKRSQRMNPDEEELKAGMISDLKKQGIGLVGWDVDPKNNFKHIRENYDYFSFHLDGSSSTPYVDIPLSIWDQGDGHWIEDIAGLSIAESWDCDEVNVGVSIGQHTHKDRMGSLRGLLRNHRNGNWARVRDRCLGAGVLPSEFSGILSNESRNGFISWLIDTWKELPPDIRGHLTPLCARRDLDVFVETSSGVLFVECKRSPASGKKSAVQNKAQLESLVFAVAGRGIKFSILAHSDHNQESWRSYEYEYIIPWSLLRRRSEMIKAPIKRKEPLKKWGRRKMKKVGGPKAGIIEAPPFTGTVQEEDVFYCPDCMDTFETKKELRTHRLSEGHASFKCEVCSKILPSDNDANTHIKTARHAVSGICYTNKQMIVPAIHHKDLEEKLIEEGFFQRAIDAGCEMQALKREIKSETGKNWKFVFGCRWGISMFNFFNNERGSQMTFTQGAKDGLWYASEPNQGSEEE